MSLDGGCENGLPEPELQEWVPQIVSVSSVSVDAFPTSDSQLISSEVEEADQEGNNALQVQVKQEPLDDFSQTSESYTEGWLHNTLPLEVSFKQGHNGAYLFPEGLPVQVQIKEEQAECDFDENYTTTSGQDFCSPSLFFADSFTSPDYEGESKFEKDGKPVRPAPKKRATKPKAAAKPAKTPTNPPPKRPQKSSQKFIYVPGRHFGCQFPHNNRCLKRSSVSTQTDAVRPNNNHSKYILTNEGARTVQIQVDLPPLYLNNEIY